MKPKPDPILTGKRVGHAITGAVITLLAFAVGGYGWLVHGLTASVAVGIAWERITPPMARFFGWEFPHGNAWDVAWWAIGSCAVIGIVEVMAR